jgi:hypothetical protein
MLGITYQADWLVSNERGCRNANYFEDTHDLVIMMLLMAA